MKPKTTATTVTPKQLSIALRHDVVRHFLAEVKDEIDLVEQHDAGLELLKIGSRKKVAGIRIRIQILNMILKMIVMMMRCWIHIFQMNLMMMKMTMTITMMLMMGLLGLLVAREATR
jgi:hypothetical protein